MDERKERRRHYFEELASAWDDMFPPQDLERLAGLIGGFGLMPGGQVLDVGCGTGRLVRVLLHVVPGLDGVVGVDISLDMLVEGMRRIGEPRARFLQADAEQLPLAEGTFHAVICFATFPHLDAKEAALAEFRRVTSPGGQLVILHLRGREEMNQFHQQLPEAVSSDVLPSIPEMLRLVRSAGYDDVTVENRPDLFLLCARRAS